MAAVRIYQGVVVANAFNFFMAAGQACLIPFLSLYFLYLDLNPLQTGLLIGVKAFTGALSSAFWTQCVTTTARRLKFVLVFSLLILVASHLVMVLMPSMKAGNRDLFCPSPPETSNFPVAGNCSQFGNQSSCSESTNFPEFIKPTDQNKDLDTVTGFPLANETTILTETIANSTTIITEATLNSTTRSSSVIQETLTTPSTIISSVELLVGTPPKESETPLIRSSTPPNTNTANGQLSTTIPHNNLDDYWQKDNTDYTYKRRKRHSGHEEDEAEKPHLSESDPLAEGSEQPFLNKPILDVLPSTDDGKSLKGEMENRLKSIQNQVFSAMLVLVIVSELFSSPCQQVSDELYASFLESNELPMSSRKTTGCWSLLGGSITPWIIVALVDRLPCHVPPSGSHRILFHFWIFTIIHLITFLFSICFPSMSGLPPDLSRVPPDSPLAHHHHRLHHNKKWANLARGLKLVATSGRTVLGSITIFVVGFVQGVIGTFLPWIIHDLVKDGSEFYIGAAIGLASAGDLASRLFGEWISRKMGHLVAIMFGLLITATRLTLYGFLMRPWMALIGESAHAIGGALIATAVADHPAFKLTSKGIDSENENGSSKKRKLSRGYGSLASFAAAESMSVNSALKLIQTGVGFPVGCCVGGILAHQFGMPMAFWVASGTAVGWCVLFGIFYPCCKTRCGRTSRKKKTTGLASSLLTRHYKKLSKTEDNDEDEEEEEDDDDDDGQVDDDVSTEEEKADWMARKRAP